MPKAVKYILLPYGEYDDLLKLKKKNQSLSETSRETEPLKIKVENILDKSGITDYEKITLIIKYLTDVLHRKVKKSTKNIFAESKLEKSSIDTEGKKTSNDEIPEDNSMEVDEDISTEDLTDNRDADVSSSTLVNEKNQEKDEPNELLGDHKNKNNKRNRIINTEKNTQDGTGLNSNEEKDSTNGSSRLKRIRKSRNEIDKDWLYY